VWNNRQHYRKMEQVMKNLDYARVGRILNVKENI
jgi:hypothetical protein